MDGRLPHYMGEMPQASLRGWEHLDDASEGGIAAVLERLLDRSKTLKRRKSPSIKGG